MWWEPAPAAVDALGCKKSARRRAGAEATAHLRESLDKGVGRGAAAHGGKKAARTTKMEEIREELAAFLNFPVSPRGEASDACWGEPVPGSGDGARAYSSLWRGARRFHCLPASNGDVGRLFSAARQLLEQRR